MNEKVIIILIAAAVIGLVGFFILTADGQSAPRSKVEIIGGGYHVAGKI